MLKERRRAAELVTADFLKAERAADEAAVAAADCVATMLRQRMQANLPVDTGIDALRLVSEASIDLVRARQRLVEAHAALVDVRTGVGLQAFGYGDGSECPPSSGSLAAQTPARLAAVA